MKILQVVVVAVQEIHPYQVQPGEVEPRQPEISGDEPQPTQEWDHGPLHIEETEVVHQPGQAEEQVPVARQHGQEARLVQRLLRGVDPDQKLPHGEVQDLVHLHGQVPREVEHLHGEETVEEPPQEGTTRLERLVLQLGMILKLRLLAYGMHLLLGFDPPSDIADLFRRMQQRHRLILLRISLQTMTPLQRLGLNLPKHLGFQGPTTLVHLVRMLLALRVTHLQVHSIVSLHFGVIIVGKW